MWHPLVTYCWYIYSQLPNTRAGTCIYFGRNMHGTFVVLRQMSDRHESFYFFNILKINILCTRPENKRFAWVLWVQNSDRVVPKTVSGVLPAHFLFHQALLLNFQNRPGGHYYLEGHVYLVVESTLMRYNEKHRQQNYPCYRVFNKYASPVHKRWDMPLKMIVYWNMTIITYSCLPLYTYVHNHFINEPKPFSDENFTLKSKFTNQNVHCSKSQMVLIFLRWSIFLEDLNCNCFHVNFQTRQKVPGIASIYKKTVNLSHFNEKKYFKVPISQIRIAW